MDVAEAVVVFIAVVAIVLFLIFIGIPLLVALGELVLLLVLVVAGVLARVVFRRPWIIDAIDPIGGHHTWQVVGWRRSGAARRFITDRMASTGEPPTPEEVLAAALAS